MKRIVSIALVLALSVLLSGCFMLPGNIIILPSNDTIGEPKTFQKDGLTLTLTDRFVEEESRRGFDAYYVADFGGVMVLIEPFTSEKGLAERPLSEYIGNVIENNGHDAEPKNEDGLWYFINDVDDIRYYSFCHKGSDAFYFIQFACYLSDVDWLEAQIFMWAQAVEVE